MAVYKPTNCLPYLTSFDLTGCLEAPYEPEFFECKVDTSNKNVTAYAITIYNSENTQIFPIDNTTDMNPISPIDNLSFVEDLRTITGTGDLVVVDNSGYINLNTGVNGSYLRIPFINNSNTDTSGWGSVIYNALTVEKNESMANGYSIISHPRGFGNIPIIMENGQTYKWVITLYQGTASQNGTPVFPTNIYEFDMIVTTGQVMGSNIERVQSYLSDEIYVDYYIQPGIIKYTTESGEKATAYIKVVDEKEGVWCSTTTSGGTTAVTNPTFEAVGDRVRIKNYDSSYGYIYPQTGDNGFSENTIKLGGANVFQIFSMSNNEEDLTTTRMVQVVPYARIPWTWNTMIGSESSSYGQQVYYMEVNDEAIPPTFYPFNTVRESGLSGVSNELYKFVQYISAQNKIGISSQTRVVLNYQHSTNEQPTGEGEEQQTVNWYLWRLSDQGGGVDNDSAFPIDNDKEASPFNGIFTPEFEVGEVESKTVDGQPISVRQVTVNWYRASDADTWGELINKIVKVTSTAGGTMARFSSENIQTRQYESPTGEPIDDSTAQGTLNGTPIKFSKELPLTIYSHTAYAIDDRYDLLNNTGLILYNRFTADSEGQAIMYVRPFVGLEPKMWFRELTSLNSSARMFAIEDVNTTTWAIKYSPDEIYTGKTIGQSGTAAQDKEFDIGQRYQIRTFYKSSDENPFDLYGNPVITVNFWPVDSDMMQEGDKYEENDEYGAYIIGSRSFHAVADYTQEQQIWWRSFNWTLYDSNGVQVGTSGDIYDGYMEYTHYGLGRLEYYTLVLTVETYSGNIYSSSYRLYVNFDETGDAQTFPFNLSFDCDTNSVIMDFLLTGYIIPNVKVSSTTYRRQDLNNNDTDPTIPGVSYPSSASSLSNGMMMISNEIGEEGVVYDSITNGTTSITSVSDLETSDNSFLVQSSHVLTDEYFSGNIYTVDFDNGADSNPVQYKLKIYIPEEMETDSDGAVVGNSQRNKVLYDIVNSSDATVIDGPVEATLYNVAGIQMVGNKWQQDRAMISEWQPKVLFPSSGNTPQSRVFGNPQYISYKNLTYDILVGTGDGFPESSHYKIKGPFNTTLRYRNGYPTASGFSSVEWAVNAPVMSSPLAYLLRDEMGGDLTMGADSETPPSYDNHSYVTGFYCQSEDGSELEPLVVIDNNGSTAANSNYFSIVNKAPVLWCDFSPSVYSFDSVEGWSWAVVNSLDNNGRPASGTICQSFTCLSQLPFIWGESGATSSTNEDYFRWIDGWGFNNNAVNGGIEQDGGSAYYNADNSGQIWVGNQGRVTEESLTNSERGEISGSTFVIEAAVDLSSGSISHSVSIYYISNN